MGGCSNRCLCEMTMRSRQRSSMWDDSLDTPARRRIKRAFALLDDPLDTPARRRIERAFALLDDPFDTPARRRIERAFASLDNLDRMRRRVWGASFRIASRRGAPGVSIVELPRRIPASRRPRPRRRVAARLRRARAPDRDASPHPRAPTGPSGFPGVSTPGHSTRGLTRSRFRDSWAVQSSRAARGGWL
jgi:hypothetical protein